MGMNRNRPRAGVLALASLLFLGVAACGGTSPRSDAAGQVTVYTGRHYGIEAVFEQFTADTGIQVRFTTGSDPELRERLIAEGDNTPADLVITADAANMDLLAAAGVLAPVDSESLRGAIPVELRSADDTWFALSRRLRVITYSTDRVENPPSTYAGLGDERWKGRLCLRPSTHPYTQSLVAGLIDDLGADRAQEIVESWVANDPLYINSDSDIIKAIAAGDCDVALANHYYLARALDADPDLLVGLIWPDQNGSGAHLNVSAAAVTAAAPNPTGAIRLLEWLASTGQKAFSDANNEYPADPRVEPAAVLADFGPFVADAGSVRALGRLNVDATQLLSRAGYR